MDASEYGSLLRALCISVSGRDLFFNRQRHIVHKNLILFTTSARCIKMLLQRNQGVALGTSHLNSRPYHGHRKPHNRGPNRGAQQRGIVSRCEYRRACKYGLKCKYLFTGTCHYDHTEYELAEYRRKWAEQVAELNQGLDDLEMVVRAGEGVRVDANVDSIGIADVQELASFNKTSDGEIAVPGLSCLNTILLLSRY